LVVLTPKSLLRSKHAVSRLEDFTGESHFRRILSDPAAPKDAAIKRLVLCTGKLSYELMEARDAAGDKTTSIVRIEQLYPFPGEALLARLKRMTHVEEIIWAQEEPQNQGYWAHVEPRLERRIGEAKLKPKRPVYAGRAAAASPATGLAKRHAAEQAALIADALGHSSAPAAAKQAS
jgi:2-oxoglutarate dehydrogenase E1 component